MKALFEIFSLCIILILAVVPAFIILIFRVASTLADDKLKEMGICQKEDIWSALERTLDKK